MSTQSDAPKQLSSRLKDMKFMKRKEETNLRTKLEQERARDEESMRWTVTSAAGASVVVDDEDDAPSMVRVPGRRSFGGFNQNVEKLVSDSKLTVEQLAARAAAEQDSINDEEMASRYEKFSGMRGKGAAVAAANRQHQHQQQQQQQQHAAKKFKPNPTQATASKSSNRAHDIRGGSFGDLSAHDADNGDSFTSKMKRPRDEL